MPKITKPSRNLKTVGSLICLAIAFAFAPPSKAQDAAMTPDKRLENATASIDEVMNAPDKGIPRDLYNKARCVVIIPDVLKAAFIVGGKYGRGFVSCRNSSGRFGPPAAIRIEGGSYGLQIGGSSTDVYMLIMNKSGMRKLLSDKFTIGGEASAAAGPVGRNTSANTDILLHSEIISWSRSRGLFAGVSLEGSTLRPDNSENEKLYGEKISNRRILSGEAPMPPAAKPLVAELNRYRRGEGSGDVESSLGSKSRVALTDVQFETGKADITPDSETALNSVLSTLKDHADWKVRVEGFTDNVGGKAANEKLSADRAEAVANWLADHGIDRSRLSSKGYGPARPVASNKTDDGRAKNRRVELVRL